MINGFTRMCWLNSLAENYCSCCVCVCVCVSLFYFIQMVGLSAHNDTDGYINSSQLYLPAFIILGLLILTVSTLSGLVSASSLHIKS